MDEPPEPAQVALVRAFLDHLAAGALDDAADLLADDVAYTNVSLPTIRGRERVRRLAHATLGRPAAGFEVHVHAVSASDGVVLTERTDVLTHGRLRVQFWVYGRFEVRDGRISVWRDSFDWLDVTRATLRGLAGCLVPALRAKAPATRAAAVPAAVPTQSPGILRVVPDLHSPHPARAAAFYARVLGLDVVMDLGWVVTLADPHRPAAQLTLAAGDATAVVAPDVSVQVTDVDAAYATALAAGAEVVHPLTDEPWGVRRFMVQAPDGHVVNVLAHG